MPARLKIAKKIKEIGVEHTGIRAILVTIEGQKEMKGLATALEQLHGVLRSHFELEEGSGGLAQVIGSSAPNLLDPLHRILAEHDGLLGQVRELMGLVHEKRAAPASSVKQRVAAMVARVRAHEAAESELLSSATTEEAGVGD